MVGIALANSKIIFGQNSVIADMDLKLAPQCGLLYPSKDAQVLSELPPDQRPKQLVLLDGTWPQARTMVRDIPVLKDLPCYKLAPSEPGKYRIRLEPTDTSLSTVEAAVQALREIEPKTKGLDQLLVAFDTMVQKQLDHPKVGREHYSGGPKSGRTINVPQCLSGPLSQIVVAYGEKAYRPAIENKKKNAPRPPVFWTAKRLAPLESGDGSDMEFTAAIEPEVEMTKSFLNYLELPKETFDHAISAKKFTAKWNQFLRHDDILLVYKQGTIGLLNCVGGCTGRPVTLKSINFAHQGKRPSASEILENEGLAWDTPNPAHGRAGRRLEKAIALIKFFRGETQASDSSC